MAVGIKVEECEDYRNKSCYLVTKKRGKLSQDDIINAMNSEELYGIYILVIKVNGEPRGADGWDGGIEPKEDTAIIYPVDDKFKVCLICRYNPWEISYRHCVKDLIKNIS